jgi:hypothetical protein
MYRFREGDAPQLGEMTTPRLLRAASAALLRSWPVETCPKPADELSTLTIVWNCGRIIASSSR